MITDFLSLPGMVDANLSQYFNLVNKTFFLYNGSGAKENIFHYWVFYQNIFENQSVIKENCHGNPRRN